MKERVSWQQPISSVPCSATHRHRWGQESDSGDAVRLPIVLVTAVQRRKRVGNRHFSVVAESRKNYDLTNGVLPKQAARVEALR